MKATKVIISKKKAEDYSGEFLVTFVARGSEGDIFADSFLGPMLKSLQEFKEFNGKKRTISTSIPVLVNQKACCDAKGLCCLGLGI